MSTTYPQDSYTSADLARTAYSADQAFSVTRAQGLVDLDVIALSRPVPVYFTEVSTTSTSYEVKASFRLVIPDYADAMYFELWIDAKVDAGTGTWKLVDNATATDGSEIAVTQTAYTALQGPSQLLIDDTWVDTIRTVEVQAKVTSTNTHTLRSTGLVLGRFTD